MGEEKLLFMKYIPAHNYQEIRVDGLNEIYSIIQKYNQFYNLPRSVFTDGYNQLQAFYRGQSNSEWDISPSILRSSEKETKIIQDLKPPHELSLFATISYIQHYHTGTRFVDFTLDPDIAMYFACAGSEDKSGALYLYNYVPHEAEWYSALVLAEITQIETDKFTILELSERILKKYPKLKSRFSTVEELNGAIVSFLEHGFMVMPDDESYGNNLRLKRQKGCFYVCGVKFVSELTSRDHWFSRAGRNEFFTHSAIIPNGLKRGNGLVKVIIPAKLKSEILKYLTHQGITKEYLFPNEK